MTMLTFIASRAALRASVWPLLLVVAVGCSSAGAPPASSPDAAEQASADRSPDHVTFPAAALASSGITVAAATAERRAAQVETPAVLQLNETRTARLGSVVDGVVSGAEAQVGQRIQQGQRVVSIHSHTVHDAWASYRKAVADRQRATAELSFATSAEARVSRLLAAKAVSLQETERARTELNSAEQALAIANSELQRSLDELEHLGIKADAVETVARQDAVPVISPLAGVILERLVTSGTAVTVGTPLYVISDLHTLWAIAELDEARLPLLTVGGTAIVTVAAYPERPFTARVRAIGDSVNPETRRVTVRLEVDNQQGLLKPQMFATVRLAAGADTEVVSVPATALQQFDQQTVVFVEVAPGTFRRQPVTAGRERDGRVEVSGVAVGTRVAVGSTFLLKSKLLEAEQPE